MYKLTCLVTYCNRCQFAGAGFTVIAIIFTQVQVTLLLGDITSALASTDADRVNYRTQLDSFKVSGLQSPVSYESFTPVRPSPSFRAAITDESDRACASRSLLVHGQVAIIFVVSVCLSVCLFVCLFVQSFSQPSSI